MPTVLNVMTCLSLVVAVASTQPDLAEARAAFTEGRFLKAADLAEAVGGSHGFALAAEALAIHAHYEAAEEAWDAIVERATRNRFEEYVHEEIAAALEALTEDQR